MASTITFCMDNPIRTPVGDWMDEHIGRQSVGFDRGEDYDIVAYSDQDSDGPELYRMARKMNAQFINSFESEGLFFVE